MSQSYPAFAVFPDLNCILRLPTGLTYRGKLRQHPATDVKGEHWYEGYLKADHKDHVTADTTLRDRFNRDGARPAYFHPQSTVEPLRIKLNRLPEAKRVEKNADTLVGEVWNHEGLWTVVASPSQSPSLHLAGSVAPARAELGYGGSRIRHHQPDAPAATASTDEPKAARKPRSAPRQQP